MRDLSVGVILVGQSAVVEPELRRCGWRGHGDRQDGDWDAARCGRTRTRRHDLTKGQKPTPLLDVGANAECKAHHLAQFAIVGDAYCRAVLGTVKPSVGSICIGEEEATGNDLTKEVFPPLRDLSSLNFVGNVEGRDISRARWTSSSQTASRATSCSNCLRT